MKTLSRLATTAVTTTMVAAAMTAGVPTATQAMSAQAELRAGTSGSIVYVKAYDVWIADGTGAHAHRVTRDGTLTTPYVSPSESDAGVIAAGHGTLIVRMDQHGKVLSAIDPPALTNSAGEHLDGAINDVALSPNGRTIAWSFVRYSCPTGADCLVRFATGYTAAAKYRKAGASTFYRAPSWVGNARTLQTGGSGSQVMLQDVAHAPQHWFDDSDMNFPSTDLADGELSPDGRWLAEIRGYGASSTIAWYAVTGDATTGVPPAAPTYACVTNADPRHASPTWSPDSSAVAWAGEDGIIVQPAAASCGAGSSARLLVRGGSWPDWSSAPLR